MGNVLRMNCLIGGELNGHVATSINGYEGVDSKMVWDSNVFNHFIYEEGYEAGHITI